MLVLAAPAEAKLFSNAPGLAFPVGVAKKAAAIARLCWLARLKQNCSQMHRALPPRWVLAAK